jgi:hypothetical protein
MKREESLFEETKPECVEKGGETKKPNSASLFEAIEGFAETAYMSGMCRIHKNRGLSVVDGLNELTIEKGILDIKLMDRPFVGGGDAQNDPNGCGLHNGAKSFPIVHTLLLSEPTEHPSSFVPC